MKKLTEEMANEYMEYLQDRLTPGCGLVSDLLELAFYSGASVGFMSAVTFQDEDVSLFDLSALTNRGFLAFLKDASKALGD